MEHWFAENNAEMWGGRVMKRVIVMLAGTPPSQVEEIGAEVKGGGKQIRAGTKRCGEWGG